jgi:pyruvate kinase
MLNNGRMAPPYRHTKIIFTIGPATFSPEVLTELLQRGVDVCRFNMAHADHAWVRAACANLLAAQQRAGRKVALMMDIKGPEIRTGPLDEPFELRRGELFDFFATPGAEPVREPVPGVRVNYPGMIHDVRPGDTVLVDSGLLRLRVESVDAARIRCSVRIGGQLGSRRHINLPGVRVNLPALTDKDRADVRFGIELGFDFFALSFVREPADLDSLRRCITEQGARAAIIAKIEDQAAVTNLDEIIRASDGLMVARGDLGIEIPYETLPLVQRRAVRSCLAMGKPVIVATHMLESMIHNPVPTRAEITDVANAVAEQADCVMLSGETTTGKFPVACVDVLNRIILSTEGVNERPFNTTVELRTPKTLLLRSAVIFSEELKDSVLLVFTRSGFLARVLSALRPQKSPIYAFTDVNEVFQQLLLYWGVEPFFMTFDADPEKTIRDAMRVLIEKGWSHVGKPVVVISNVLVGERIFDTIQFRKVE